MSAENKVMIVERGSRGPATAKHFRDYSPEVGDIYLAPGNAGTDFIEGAQNINLDPMDNKQVVEAALDCGVDLVIVAPENPLENGIVNALNETGVTTFGPSKEAARIEWDKAWAMNILDERGIPHPQYVVCNPEEAHKFIDNIPEWGENGLAIKASNLRFGKGVIMADSLEEAHEAVDILNAEKLVIQEKLEGYEVSSMAIVGVDGKDHIMLPYGEDYKQSDDEDRGNMTGGMGVRVPHPLITPQIARQIENEVMIPLINAIKNMGVPSNGVLYPALFITKDGIKVIEVNFRPGSTEWETILRLTDSNLYKVLKAAAVGNFKNMELKFKNENALSVVLAAKGYPDVYEEGKEINGLDKNREGVVVYHAGTKKREDKYVSSGGRVLVVTGTGETFEETYSKTYGAIGPDRVNFEGMHYRKDIGKRR